MNAPITLTTDEAINVGRAVERRYSATRAALESRPHLHRLALALPAAEGLDLVEAIMDQLSGYCGADDVFAGLSAMREDMRVQEQPRSVRAHYARTGETPWERRS